MSGNHLSNAVSNISSSSSLVTGSNAANASQDEYFHVGKNVVAPLVNVTGNILRRYIHGLRRAAAGITGTEIPVNRSSHVATGKSAYNVPSPEGVSSSSSTQVSSSSITQVSSSAQKRTSSVTSSARVKHSSSTGRKEPQSLSTDSIVILTIFSAFMISCAVACVALLTGRCSRGDHYSDLEAHLGAMGNDDDHNPLPIAPQNVHYEGTATRIPYANNRIQRLADRNRQPNGIQLM